MYTNNICKPETILYYDDCELTNNLESTHRHIIILIYTWVFYKR